MTRKLPFPHYSYHIVSDCVMGTSESKDVPQQSGNFKTVTCDGTCINGNNNTVNPTTTTQTLRRKNRSLVRSLPQKHDVLSLFNTTFIHSHSHNYENRYMVISIK